MDAAMRIFERSRVFPKEEAYSLTDQMRRTSRAVCANLAEAWRKRRYEKFSVSKIVDAEGEASKTEAWIGYAVRCGYLSREEGRTLYLTYEEILRTLFGMATHRETWVLNTPAQLREEASFYDSSETPFG